MNNWNREETLLLISLYKARPSLYDPTNIEYNKKEARDREINAITKDMELIKPDITPFSVRNKIRTLMNQLSRERSILRRAEQSGAPCKPKLWCYKDLEFLRNIQHDRDEPQNESDNTCSTHQNERLAESQTSSKRPFSTPFVSQYRKKANTVIEIARSIISESQTKSKEDTFGEMLALELKDLKFEENYDCALRNILKCLQEIKRKDRQLFYEASSRNIMEPSTTNSRLNVSSSSHTVPRLQMLTVENNDNSNLNRNSESNLPTVMTTIYKIESEENCNDLSV